MANCKDKQSNTNSSLKGKMADRVRDRHYAYFGNETQIICSIYSFFPCEICTTIHVCTRKTRKFSGEGQAPDPTPFGSYGALIFAPPVLMLGPFGLHLRTLAHGEVEVGGIEPTCSFEIEGDRRPGVRCCIMYNYVIGDWY